jgi:hypothetical protein
MAEENLRVVAVALAALVAVWPAKYSTRLTLFAISGVLVVSSSWSATFASRDLDWAIVLVVLIAVGLGWAVVVLYTTFTTPMYTWVLFAGCLGAIYVCVPENDQINEIGLLFTCAALAELLTRRRLPISVWAAATIGMLWSAVYGASGQGRAIIGGLFALVPVIAVAVYVRWSTSTAVSNGAARWLIASIWIVAAWTVARTGGIADTATAAWVAVAIAAPIATVMTLGVRRYQQVGVKS